ncbi:MAG: hypothetical protein HY898_32005 [Deltaproteobacteria bacterium]|nr:hypothetical protein [Deltaproteobacteria bacterium]
MRFGLALLFACGLTIGCSAGGNDPPYVSGGGSGGAPDGSAGSAGTSDGSVGPDTPMTFDQLVIDTPPQETTVVEGGYDGTGPDPDAPPLCSDAPPPAAQISVGICATATDDECDGKSDPPNMQGHSIPNGAFGNGFDDDCDGLVDEGCDCDGLHQVGTTKDCYLMPSSWVDDATKVPVGWCALNSKGTVKCVSKGGNPENPIREWDGECRGAQPPFNDDACSAGDFNCDGVPLNPLSQDCGCIENPVTCPTEPVKMNPFPDGTDLTKKDPLNPLIDPGTPFIIDGYAWIADNVEQQATGWSWELTGGDCDNILPHPTFAIYKGSTGQSGKIGTQGNNLGSNGKQHGFTTPADNAQHQIWPAFSLSGDYILKGKFELQGKNYECTLKVQVRAPGIRAELCWDTAGDDGNNDVDLHFARLQGNSGCAQHGWFLPCDSAPNADDCYYNSSSGCTSGDDPGWGYADSHKAACHGWGSLRGTPGFPDNFPCTNPRLDRDNISCAPGQTDPNGWPIIKGEFCGPENINLDNPKSADRFVVGAQCYDCVGTKHPATHPHINIYCNGERKLSAGYDPANPPPYFPALIEGGADWGGSLWEAAVVTWKGDPADPCQIDPIPSKTPNPQSDGTNQNCVENGPENNGTGQPTDLWLFSASGAYPTTPASVCWH